MMIGTATAEAGTARDLDPETSARVFRRACQRRAPVRLRILGAGGEAVCVGVAVANDGSQLALEVTGIEPSVAAMLAAAEVRADMGLADARYAFETRCVGPPEGAGGLLRLAQPNTVTIVERRRSPRRRFRAPAEVRLQAMSEAESWHGQAALLNLGADGMACRVREDDTANTRVGRMLRVAFCLDGSPEVFELTGRVVNVTQAGSPRHAVVGMLFVDDGRLVSAREALLAALRNVP